MYQSFNLVRASVMSFALAVAMVMSGTAQATILTFNDDVGGPVAANGVNIPSAYGDNVTALTQGGFGYGVGAEGFTPNVTVEWGFQDTGLEFQVNFWNAGYGDLTNIAYSSTTMLIQLTSAGPLDVAIYEFDVAGFSSPRDGTITIEDGSSNVLYSSGPVSYAHPAHTNFDFTSNPIFASVLQIRVNGPGGGLFGIDNIRFGEFQIPEPGSISLVALGCTALVMRRRRAA